MRLMPRNKPQALVCDDVRHFHSVTTCCSRRYFLAVLQPSVRKRYPLGSQCARRRPPLTGRSESTLTITSPRPVSSRKSPGGAPARCR